jgi:hypothetical protein
VQSSSNVWITAGADSSASTFNWGPNGSPQWKQDDADGCANSGSLYETPSTNVIGQCRPVSGGGNWSIGFMYKNGDSIAQGALCYYDFYVDASCTTEVTPFGESPIGNSTNTSSWTAVGPVSVAMPSNTMGVRIECDSVGGAVYYDQLYFSPGSGGF